MSAGANGLPSATAASEHNEFGRSPTLRVLSEGREVFSSFGHWLHPLFELETFLEVADYAPEELSIEDKIIGRAAAFLMVRMGFRSVYGGTMSRLAKEVFETHGVDHSFGTLIDRIGCRTEGLLARIDDPEQAYALVKDLART